MGNPPEAGTLPYLSWAGLKTGPYEYVQADGTTGPYEEVRADVTIGPYEEVRPM
jgi:hypothetical protein